jgi:lysophospholipase L1-like esterase
MRMPSARTSLVSSLAAWLVVAGVTVVLLEAALRLAGAVGLITLWQERDTALNNSIWMKSDDPDLVYLHRPDYSSKGISYTEHSGILRPVDVPEQAAPGTFRIAVLGDSVVAATELSYPERAVTQLEEMLGGQYMPRAMEVLNFGVNGYSTLQEAALLDELVDRFAPDMLVLQYCMNDFYPSEQPYRWFVDHSPFYLIDQVESLIEQRKAIGYPPVAYWETLYRQDTAGWQNVSNGFTRIARYAADHDIPVLLVIYPLVSQEGWYAGDATGRHASVARLAEQAGFEVLDLLPVLAAYDIETIRFKPWDTFHPNALGQRIAVQAMAQWFAGHVELWDRPGL